MYFVVTVPETSAVDSQLQDLSCSDVEPGALTHTITAGTEYTGYRNSVYLYLHCMWGIYRYH